MKSYLFLFITLFFININILAERFYYLDNFNNYTNNTELSNNFTMATGVGGSGTIDLQEFSFDDYIYKAVRFNYNIGGGWSLASKQLSQSIDMTYYSNIHFYIKGTTASTDDTIKMEIKDSIFYKTELKSINYFKITTNWEYYVFNINTDFTNSGSANLSDIKEFLFTAVSGSGTFYLDEIFVGSYDITNYYHFSEPSDYTIDNFNNYSNNVTNYWYIDSGTSNVITSLDISDSGYEGKCLKISYDTSQSPYYGKIVFDIKRSISDWSKFKYIKINYKGEYNDAYRILMEDIYGNWWQSDDIVLQNTYLNWDVKYFDITKSFSSIYEQNIGRFIIVIKGEKNYGTGDFYLDDIELVKTINGEHYTNSSSQSFTLDTTKINIENKILKVGTDNINLNFTVVRNSKICMRLYSLNHYLIWNKEIEVSAGEENFEKQLSEIKGLMTGLYILYVTVTDSDRTLEKRILLNINK